MGAYSEYLSKQHWSYPELQAERKKQLQRIATLRDRDVLVIAADQSKAGLNAPISMDYSDILPVEDQLSVLTGKKLDVIIETPGGLAEAAESIVRSIRSKYETVGMIVPGWAKSAGTIFVMAGDEILMGDSSALGPIDPQLLYPNGRRISADAVLEGLDKIKEEVLAQGGKLNPAFIPILQNISPGEIQSCINAREFSQTLVREWLVNYKFKFWNEHETSKTPVSDEQKLQRASEIAGELCRHAKWLTHSRSITRSDLEQLGLKITNYTLVPELHDAISRYNALLRMSFEMTGMYKIYETPTHQVLRFLNAGQVAPQLNPQTAPISKPGKASIDYECPKCKKHQKIQATFDKNLPLDPDHIPFPSDNLFNCPDCGTQGNLLALRLQIEAQLKTKIQ